jgi:hypothetical protein
MCVARGPFGEKGEICTGILWEDLGIDGTMMMMMIIIIIITK